MAHNAVAMTLAGTDWPALSVRPTLPCRDAQSCVGDTRERFEQEALVHVDSLYRVALRMTGNENDADCPLGDPDEKGERQGGAEVADDDHLVEDVDHPHDSGAQQGEGDPGQGWPYSSSRTTFPGLRRKLGAPPVKQKEPQWLPRNFTAQGAGPAAHHRRRVLDAV